MNKEWIKNQLRHLKPVDRAEAMFFAWIVFLVMIFIVAIIATHPANIDKPQSPPTTELYLKNGVSEFSRN